MFINDFKIATRHLKKNYLRFIYNLFLSMVLCFLSLSIITTIITIKINGDNLSHDRYYMDENISLSAKTYSGGFSKKELFEIDNYLKENNKYTLLFDFLATTDSSIDAFVICDINYCVNKGIIKLKNNNLPNTNYLYISYNYAKENNLNVGDTITRDFYFKKEKYSISFEIADIFEGNASDVIFDISILNDNNTILQKLDIFMINIIINKDNDINDTINFQMELNRKLSKFNDENVEIKSTRFDEYSRIKMMTNVFFYVTLIFVIIIIILVTSIISHSSLIMIDLDKKSFALYKTLGMKNKDVSIIVLIEILLSFILGQLISILLFYGISNAIYKYLTKMYASLYNFIEKTYLDNYNIIMYNSFYIPLIYTFVITFALSIFSYNSIKKLFKKNTISLLNREG